MNKKENDQLKKIEKLDQQLDSTISKIGATKVKPVKISKKKLALFMLIPFSIACVISAVTSFLLIDPFHWYTKPRSDLEQQQEKQIKQINKQFADLNLASGLDSSNTIANLLFEMRNHSNINDIVKKPNEISSITSKKDGSSKLLSSGEEVDIKIVVRTGSLEKEINVQLLVLVGNYRVKQVKELVEYSKFLNSITAKIETDGIKRVSNLVDIIKTTINENEEYKKVFNDINFDITNDKNDDEIIASGLKALNVNFDFTENNKLISSCVKLSVGLQGKSRKEINQYLGLKLNNYPLSFMSFYDFNNFIAQTSFANESSYKDLIDEFMLSAPKNNFYFSTDNFKAFDNTDSKISVNFSIKYKNTKQLNEKIDIGSGNWWGQVMLNFQVFLGNGQGKYLSIETNFSVIVMKNNYPQKDLFIYIANLREAIHQDLFKYKAKSKIGNKYDELSEELLTEINRIKKTIKLVNNMYDFRIELSYVYSDQRNYLPISAENLNSHDGFYITWIVKLNGTVINKKTLC